MWCSLWALALNRHLLDMIISLSKCRTTSFSYSLLLFHYIHSQFVTVVTSSSEQASLHPTTYPNLPGKKIIHEYHTPSLGDPFKECPRDESMQMISVLLPSSSWSPDSFLLSGANPHIQAVTCGKLHLCVGRRYSWRPQHARHIPLH